MRTAGFHNADILADLIERLIFLADLGVAAAEQLIQENAPYWNGDNCVGAGLLSIAAMLPDHPNAAQWETFGWKNMTGYFGNKSVLPDGTFHEAFPWAEGYGLEFLYPVLAILRSKQDIDLPNLQLSPTRTLHDAIQWQLNVASPLGEIPTLNDTSGYDICMGGYANLAVLGQWANLPEVWKAFRVTDFRLPLYLHAHRPDNPPEPEPESLLLPDIGWSFLRSGQGLNAFHSMFDHGIHPSGHCMPQNLTFDMVCHGHHWIVNSGCAPHYCTYDEQNTWHRTTKAANCIRIDNQDIPPNIDSELLEWTNHNGTVTVRGRHQGYPAVVHERTLIHQEHGPLLVLDHLTPTDGKSHTAQAFWHINGQIEKKETGRWIFTAGNNRSLYLLCPELSSATPVTEGLCGGLGRRNLNAGKLPSIDPVSPGDPGWLLVPYLSLDMEIPASGKTLITAFVPQIDTSESSWTLNIKSGNVHIFRNGEMLLSTPLE